MSPVLPAKSYSFLPLARLRSMTDTTLSRTDAPSLTAHSAMAVARLTAPWRLPLVVAGVGASSICATEVSQTAPTMQTSTPSM
jgi:hypothetical protein